MKNFVLLEGYNDKKVEVPEELIVKHYEMSASDFLSEYTWDDTEFLIQQMRDMEV